MKDLYEILEIPKTATINEIRAAYRKQALRFHPDKNHDPDANQRFQEIGGAYEILSDPVKRREYDSGGLAEKSIPVPNQTAASNLFNTFMATYAFTKNPTVALLFAGVHAVYSVGQTYNATKKPEHQAQEKLNSEFIDKLQAKNYANDADKYKDLVAILNKGADINFGKPSVFGFQFTAAIFSNSALSITALEIVIEQRMSEVFESLVLDHPNFIPIPAQLTLAVKHQKSRIMEVLVNRGLIPTRYDLAAAIQFNQGKVNWLIEKGAVPDTSNLELAIRYHNGDDEIIIRLLQAGVQPQARHMDTVLQKGMLSIADRFKALGVLPRQTTLSEIIKKKQPDLAIVFLEYGAQASELDLLHALLGESILLVKKIHEVTGIIPSDMKFIKDGADMSPLEGLPVVSYFVQNRNVAMLTELDKIGTRKKTAYDAFNRQIFFYNAVSVASLAVFALIAYRLATLFNGSTPRKPTIIDGTLMLAGISALLTMVLIALPNKKAVEDDQVFLDSVLHQ